MNPATFKTWRELLGYTQEQISGLAKVDLRTAQRWEARINPPVEVWEALENEFEEWTAQVEFMLEELEGFDSHEVTLTRYLNADSFNRAMPDSTIPWTVHNAKIGYFMARLEDAGHVVTVDFAPMEP